LVPHFIGLALERPSPRSGPNMLSEGYTLHKILYISPCRTTSYRLSTKTVDKSVDGSPVA